MWSEDSVRVMMRVLNVLELVEEIGGQTGEGNLAIVNTGCDKYMD